MSDASLILVGAGGRPAVRAPAWRRGLVPLAGRALLLSSVPLSVVWIPVAAVPGLGNVAAADVVLLGPDLDVLRAGVEEGRRAFANTLKYIAITTSANFGNMVSMALATPFLPFLPLAAKQVLLNNFLSDIPSIAISTDAVDAEQVARAERWDVDAVRRFMIVFGLVSTAFDLLTFGLLRLAFRADETTFQTAWFVVSLLTELAVVLVLRTARPSWSSRPGWVLAGATGIVAAAAIALPYVPPLARLFGFVPVGPAVLASMLAVVVGYVAATEAVKAIERTRSGGASAGRRGLVE
jgi:Mg2+-importing ATPase